jgi:hypothetical protein
MSFTAAKKSSKSVSTLPRFSHRRAAGNMDSLTGGDAGIQYATHLINSAGRQVKGFKGIGSLIKTSGYSSGGWQQVDPDDNPFKT